MVSKGTNLIGINLDALPSPFIKSKHLLLEQGEYRRTSTLDYDLPEHQKTPQVHLYEFEDALIDRHGILLLREVFFVTETVVDFPREKDIDLGDLRYDGESGRWITNTEDEPDYCETPALLLLKHGFDNYGHWLVELLPRLTLALPHLPEDCLIIVGRTEDQMKAVTFDTLGLLGIAPDRIRMVDRLTRFQTLYYVSPLTRHFHPIYISPYVPRFLADTFSPRPSRRLYVSRSDARYRRLLNEYAIIDYLTPLGFEVIYPGQMSFEAQVACFREAGLVVGVLGAGLTNIVFAQRGLRIVALRPTTMPDSFYCELAGHAGHFYSEVIGPEFGRLGSIYADFTIDLQKLALAMILSGVRNAPPEIADPREATPPGHPRPAGHELAPEAFLAVYRPESQTLSIQRLKTGERQRLNVEFGAYPEVWKPLLGDWNGDGVCGFGGYIEGQGLFGLRNDIAVGPPDYAFQFLPSPKERLVPVVGDWTGSGRQSVGLYDPEEGLFYLMYDLEAKKVDLAMRFGPPGCGWLPVSGDWDGDGSDSVGLYDPVEGFFHLVANLNQLDDPTLNFQFGPAKPGMIPIAGKWDTSGESSVGLYEEATGTFYLRCARGAHVRVFQIDSVPGKAYPFALTHHPNN